jgi:hypothetical protein
MANGDQDIVWEVLLRCAKEEKNELLFLKALQAAESTFGTESVQVGSVLGELGAFYQSIERSKDAEECEVRAEDILRKYAASKLENLKNLKNRED